MVSKRRSVASVGAPRATACARLSLASANRCVEHATCAAISAVRADSGSARVELVHEHLEAIEGGEIADELRRQLLLLDDQLGNSGLLGCAPEPVPRPLPCAFEIDGGDVARRRGNAFDLEVGRLHHHDHPNRFFRLSRPTFCSVATMVLMMIVGCPSDRYCTRHVTVLSLPFGATSRTPV